MTMKKSNDNIIGGFIQANRKINWEADYENGEYCIGENKVKSFYEGVNEMHEVLNKAKEAMEAIQGAEAWISDSEIKSIWQRKIYPAIEAINKLQTQTTNEISISK